MATLVLHSMLSGRGREFFHAELSTDESLGYEVAQLTVRTWAKGLVDDVRTEVKVISYPTAAQLQRGERLKDIDLIEKAYELSTRWHMGEVLE